MPWAVYHTELSIHVAPCDEDGDVDPKHRLVSDCVCYPKLVYEDSQPCRPIVVHNGPRASRPVQ